MRSNFELRWKVSTFMRDPGPHEERVGELEHAMDDETPTWAIRGAIREYNVADTCSTTFDIHRRCASDRAPPRQEKERAASLRYTTRFPSTTFSLSLSLSLFSLFSLSLSLSPFSRDARQPRDVKYFRGGKGCGGKRALAVCKTGIRRLKRSCALR